MSRPSQVLVLCTANVCRSPSAARLLGELLAREVDDGRLTVRTAGTEAATGDRYCEAAAELLGPGAADLRTGHASRPLDREQLEDADLVLVMERRHRAAVAGMLPSASARTFTLREAAALAAVGPGRGLDDLPGFVRGLHEARGSVAVPVHARTLAERLRRSRPVDGLDVPDAHEDPRTSHGLVMALLRPPVADLVGRLRG